MRNRIYKTLTGHRGRICGVQDQVKLGVYSRTCEVCGQTLTRKINLSGRFETWQRFFDRKTCGMLPNGKKSECLKQWLHGENNPKWRGGLPLCARCKKVKVKWYSEIYCMPCARKIIGEKTSARQKGKMPISLKPYFFKKGQRPHNFQHERCTFVGCTNKHLALGLCSKHYQQLSKRCGDGVIKTTAAEQRNPKSKMLMD